MEASDGGAADNRWHILHRMIISTLRHILSHIYTLLITFNRKTKLTHPISPSQLPKKKTISKSLSFSSSAGNL